MRFSTLGLLGGLVLVGLAGPSFAQYRTPMRPLTPAVRPPNFPPDRMPGWDWRRTYPWSPENIGRNPYNPLPVPYIQPIPIPYYQPYPVAPPPIPEQYGAADHPEQVLVPDPTGPLKKAPRDCAVIRVYLPGAFGKLSFNGADTLSTGAVRWYVTPTLPEGKPYHYDVKATFDKNGTKVTEERAVTVSPGKTSVVDFR